MKDENLPHRDHHQGADTPAADDLPGCCGYVARMGPPDEYMASLYRHATRIRVNDVQLGAEQHGQRNHPPLVLLHGFTGSAAGWGDILPALAMKGLRVIAIDMLGHGQSDAPQDPQRYSIEHCRSDILAFMQALNIQRGEAILLGYSMGGRIALYTALSGFFRALILESASPGIADPGERERRIASDNELATRIEREGVESFVTYWEALPLFASQQTLPAGQRDALHRQRLDNCAVGLASSLRGVGTGVQPDLHECLPGLTLPALLITGELDPKFCAIAQDMARHLPRATWHTVASAGHTIHLEQPTTFINLVHDFCQTV